MKHVASTHVTEANHAATHRVGVYRATRAARAAGIGTDLHIGAWTKSVFMDNKKEVGM